MTAASFTIAAPLFLVDCASLLAAGDELVSVAATPPSYSPTQNPLLFEYVGTTLSPKSNLRQAVSGEAFAPAFTNSVGTLIATSKAGVILTLNLTAVPRTQNLSFGAANSAPAKTAPLTQFTTIFPR